MRIKSSKEAYATVEKEDREESVLPSVAASDYYSFDLNSTWKGSLNVSMKQSQKIFLTISIKNRIWSKIYDILMKIQEFKNKYLILRGTITRSRTPLVLVF